MSKLTDIDQFSVEYVVMNLRSMDRIEVLGLCPHDSLVRLGYEALTTLRNYGRGRVVWHAGRPAAVIGFAEFRPGVWQAILLGTDDFRIVAKDCLRWFRDTALEIRDDLGGRRVQCESHINHWEAHRFLRSLGAKPEGPPMLQYGKSGDAYLRFVWLAHDNDRFIQRRQPHVLFDTERPENAQRPDTSRAADAA